MNHTDRPPIAGNPHVAAAITAMLPMFDENSQVRLRKKLADVKRAIKKHRDENTDRGARHVFREMIPASVLNEYGFSFEYEPRMGGRTPDWVDPNHRLLMDGYTFERGGTSRILSRIESAEASKCNKYAPLISEQSLRFLVAIYLDFCTGETLEEREEDVAALLPLFDTNLPLWGLIFFSEATSRRYVVRSQLHSGQPYGHFCVCRDSPFKAFPCWPFITRVLGEA